MSFRTILVAVTATTALAAGQAAAQTKPAPAPEQKSASAHPGLLDPKFAADTAPAKFKVKLETTKGDVVLEVTRAWAPNGADRFYSLVKIGYYDDAAFFRVLRDFMAQVGINGDPKVNAAWRGNPCEDDPVTQSNTRGMVSFAQTSQPNSRTTQLFINFADNKQLDGMRFAPFAKVVQGMEVVDKLYADYGEGAPRGAGPDQGRIQSEGNSYLKKDYPNLDYIKKATIVTP
jgi:peptidyl-prolyl cis-trans isomerase A (cyclophilin A)